MQQLCSKPKVVGLNFLYDIHVEYLLKLLRKSTRGLPIEVADSNRPSILFFVVSGLDLLDALDTHLSQKDRNEIIEWIYSYQVDVKKVKLIPSNHDDKLDRNLTLESCNPKGNFIPYGRAGFRSSSMMNSDIPWDCGYIAMTYCALATLVILGDDLSRVDRDSIIKGLKHLQQQDGSFRASALGGDSDIRLVYCAVAVSRLLNDWSGIDMDRCAGFIKNTLSYEGAFAQCPGAEAHGGSTYCALASLKLMSKLDFVLDAQEVDGVVRWCLNRLEEGYIPAGLSGRPNKQPDTCYSFWVGASLDMLDHFKYLEQREVLDSILLAQEKRGGLSKTPDYYSDPLHTYLGMAGMTFIDEELCSAKGIKLLKLDPTLNISARARQYLDNLHKSWKHQLTQNDIKSYSISST